MAEWRIKFFRQQLYTACYRHYLKHRASFVKENAELAKEMGLESEGEDSLTEWPEFFDLESVPITPKAELKAKPKPGHMKSLDNRMKQFNIRDQLERLSQADVLSQGAPNREGPGFNDFADDRQGVQSLHQSNGDAISQGCLSQYEQEDYECLSQHGISLSTFNLITTKERIVGEAKVRNQNILASQSETREI